jgi:hypothetical protein
MPIVYVHGVAVRNKEGQTLLSRNNSALDHLLQSVNWRSVQTHLRKFIAPVISTDPEKVSIVEAYWGDLGARLAWNGASFTPDEPSGAKATRGAMTLSSMRSRLVADIRIPVDQLIARFMGDVFCYLNTRGNAENPGAIPQRVLDKLLDAQKITDRTREPLIVVTNSMGCEIVSDIVTYFIPRIPLYRHIKIDYWCAVASQIGLFEELKLFLNSTPDYGADKGNRVPFPEQSNLGVWWNVWDNNDVISYSVANIIEGVDDTPFSVGQPLVSEHIGYLQEERFYKTLADRVKKAFPALR